MEPRGLVKVSDPASDQAQREEFRFGEFRLDARRRTLEKRGLPIRIGARAFDILHVLVESAPEIVDQRTLMARVWPYANVGETSLRTHMTGVRKALGEGAGSQDSLIVTVAGRGYKFTGAVAKVSSDRRESQEPLANVFPSTLPKARQLIIGRKAEIETVTSMLLEDRFVSIVGSGGIGKTTLAVAAAGALRQALDATAVFVDLGPVRSPSQVLEAVLAALGLPEGSPEPRAAILAGLSRRAVLLVLDCCEHVIAPAAELAEEVFRDLDHVRVLTTSRESLRVEGERVYRLFPLETPPDELSPERDNLLNYAAVELFLDRAAASGHQIETSGDALSLVAGICHKLDGIPLALELVASRVGVYGLQEIAKMLDQHFHLQWRHRRTALPRHQTLEATLRWSYELLPDNEERVLRRLAVFASEFTLEDARAVASSEALQPVNVPEAMAGLVARSLLQVKIRDGATRYRLLDTTRAYAHSRLKQAEECESAERSHAEHLRAVLEGSAPTGAGWSGTARDAKELLADVRAALTWSFADPAHRDISVPLASVSSRLFVTLALYRDAYAWTKLALDSFDPTMHASKLKLELYSACGFTSSRTGDGLEGRSAFEEGLALAEQLGDATRQLHFLSGLITLVHRMGSLTESLAYAVRFHEVAEHLDDPSARADAHGLLGTCLHLAGRHQEASAHLQAGLAVAQPNRLGAHILGSDARIRTLTVRARDLWISGAPQAGLDTAREAIADAASLGHPLTLCVGLFWSAPVFLWSGELETAAENARRLAYEADRLAIPIYQHLSRALLGDLATRGPCPEEGVAILEGVVPILDANAYRIPVMWFLTSLAEGQLRVGRLEAARATVETSLARLERSGEGFYLPELLRLKGEVLVAGQSPDLDGAQRAMARAMAVAMQQTATAWRLRAAISLAKVGMRRPGKRPGLSDLLDPILRLYHPGSETPDLTLAREMLGTAH
ncbi:MAG TPA: winged helix-turn-helix domain-containing protein [Caulobacteraceae bacterium]|jgi:predicted ATPase/DNA-binding winged helix-turn-helix (wHTH) protein